MDRPPSVDPNVYNDTWLDQFGEWLGFGTNAKARQFNSAEANIQRQWQEYENKLDRQFNSAEAQKARDFQKEMRDTTYQATVADLEKAGLNPVLAYMNGGSTAPSSASAAHSSAGVSSASWSGVGSASSLAGFVTSMANVLNAMSDSKYKSKSLDMRADELQYKTENSANSILKSVLKLISKTK